MGGVQIRRLTSLGEFRKCELIQKRVWGVVSVASEVLLVTQKYGGVVLGAFTGEKMVGYLYAFLARHNNRLIHWSHMMAVDPGFRNRSLGYQMKLEHRRLALAQGIRSICWTYDPLQSRNAALNLHRLGARVEEYLRDCYGSFPSRIEKGLPSDRFLVNWEIASARVRRRLKQRPPSPIMASAERRVNATRSNANGLLENRHIFLGLREPTLLVEIPVNTDDMRSRNLSLARRWRLETRRIFERYFSSGYRVEDFIPPAVSSLEKCFYLLRRTA